MKNTSELFQINLKRLVKKDGRDYEVLAEKCDMSVSMLNQLMSGKSGYSRNTIENLCKGLHCNPAELFVREEDLVKTREELILDIQRRLTALDYDELSTVLTYVSEFSEPSDSAIDSGSKTALTK